jgi:hypothetical protein
VAGSQVNGVALGAIGAGALLAYAGIKGYSIPKTLQAVVQGKSPAGQSQATPIAAAAPAAATGSSGGSAGNPAAGTTNAQNQALGKQMAAAYGWSTGQEWTDLNNIVEAESGWSDTITNGSSGAAGIAQNISGFSAGYQSGNAAQQIAWLLSYIKDRYGDPIAAWAFHLAHGWY